MLRHDERAAGTAPSGAEQSGQRGRGPQPVRGLLGGALLGAGAQQDGALHVLVAGGERAARARRRHAGAAGRHARAAAATGRAVPGAGRRARLLVAAGGDRQRRRRHPRGQVHLAARAGARARLRRPARPPRGACTFRSLSLALACSAHVRVQHV